MAALFLTVALTMALVAGRVGKGAAPEKVPEDQVSELEAISTGLDDLGVMPATDERANPDLDDAEAGPVDEAAPAPVNAGEEPPAEEPEPAATEGESPGGGN